MPSSTVYVEQYRIASAAMPEGGKVYVPRAHIRGLLMELVLKTYLAACGIYREGHELVELLDEAQALGLSISPEDRAHVVGRLQQYYCYHDILGWQFLSRYPRPSRPTTIWMTPGRQQMDDLVQSIVKQAKEQLGPEWFRTVNH